MVLVLLGVELGWGVRLLWVLRRLGLRLGFCEGFGVDGMGMGMGKGGLGWRSMGGLSLNRSSTGLSQESSDIEDSVLFVCALCVALY